VVDYVKAATLTKLLFFLVTFVANDKRLAKLAEQVDNIAHVKGYTPSHTRLPVVIDLA
jgi:hypothetical protein